MKAKFESLALERQILEQGTPATYCPDSNRIERVWQDFHANVTRNHRCKTMSHLLSNARRYLESYQWRRVCGAAR